MLAGLEQHALELDALGGLNLGAVCDRHPRREQPLHKLVPDALELAQAEEARLAACRDRWLDASHPVCRRERFCQVALQARDLVAKRMARRQLGVLLGARRQLGVLLGARRQLGVLLDSR